MHGGYFVLFCYVAMRGGKKGNIYAYHINKSVTENSGT